MFHHDPVNSNLAMLKEMDIIGTNKKITGVQLCGGQYVDAVRFKVNDEWQSKHGGDDGSGKTLLLSSDEFITKVTLNPGAWINKTTFTTSKERDISVGGDDSDKKKHNLPPEISDPDVETKILVNCRGRSGQYIDLLQFMWVDGGAYNYEV
eukprot:377644_1